MLKVFDRYFVMKAFFKLCVLIVLAGNINLAFGQNFEISGNVIDADSKKPIPFANIALKEVYKGTASNALGEFSFRVDSLPIVLVITHLSYEPSEIVVSQAESMTIELKAGKLLMDELVIKGRGNNQYAYDLVNKAYNRLSGQLFKTRSTLR